MNIHVHGCRDTCLPLTKNLVTFLIVNRHGCCWCWQCACLIQYLQPSVWRWPQALLIFILDIGSQVLGLYMHHSWVRIRNSFHVMMTLSNGNIFRVTGPLCGVNSPHKGQWRGALMVSLICARINDWVNNREAGDLRRHRGHYEVRVMVTCQSSEHRGFGQPSFLTDGFSNAKLCDNQLNDQLDEIGNFNFKSTHGTFSASLTLCEGNQTVIGTFTHKGPAMQNFEVWVLAWTICWTNSRVATDPWRCNAYSFRYLVLVQVYTLTDRVLVFVSIDARVDHVAEEVIHDVGQGLRCEDTVQGTDEDGFIRIQALGRLPYAVTVTQNPRDHLNLQHSRFMAIQSLAAISI